MLLGLPSGLALVSPFGLIGCGGGDGDPSPDATAARNPLLDLPPGELPSAALNVRIDMPPGLAQAASQVLSASGSAPIAASAAMVDVFSGGPQLATVYASDGTPLLMGWVGDGRTTLSARTTAAVLMHFALGLPLLGSSARDSLRQRLENHGVPFPSTRSLSSSLSVASQGWYERGGAYLSGLSGSGGASVEGGAVAGSVGWMVSRFSDMTATVTVTL